MGTVFNRKLVFDGLSMLKEMNTGFKRTTGYKIVDVVSVDEKGRAGTVILGKK